MPRYTGKNVDYLFQEGSFYNVVESQQQNIKNEIVTLNEDRVLNTPPTDLIDYFAKKYTIDVPVLHRDQAELDPVEAPILLTDSYRYNLPRGPVEVMGMAYILTVPYTGDKVLFRVRPNQWDSMPPRAEVNDGAIVLRMEGRDLSPDQINNTLNGTLDSIEEYLGWQRGSSEPFNAGIAAFAEGWINERRNKLLKDRQTVAGLAFPIKQRANAPTTYRAPEVKMRVAPTLPPPSGKAFKPEPVLDEAIYGRILSIIENMTHVMERSPTAFASMDEEALRQHFLVQLNGQFEGAATGETFNYNGKTDILIRAQDRNIFIGECKFWRGEKAFGETIDQILGYLSWRDTKAAILLFNRQKDFSRVIDKARETMEAHPHRKRGPQHEGETRSRYVFGNPDDHNREIVLTLMAFDVPI